MTKRALERMIQKNGFAVMSNDGFKILHGSENLTEAQQRQMEKLSARVDKIGDADRSFFQRFPQRHYRLRFAGQAEIEQHAIINDTPVSPSSPGHCQYTLVIKIAGGRLKVGFCGREGLEDCSDAKAAEIFDEMAELNPQLELIKQALRDLG
jgi:hypothetical protein